MMHLVFFLEAAENGNGVFHGRLFDQNRLKPSFQGCILFNIFSVFVKSGRPHASQGSPGKSWFEHVGSIHGSFGSSCPNQCMQFIYKQDDLAIGSLDFL